LRSTIAPCVRAIRERFDRPTEYHKEHMRNVFEWAIWLVPLLAQLMLCRFLYLLLCKKALGGELRKLLGAYALLCVAMAIVPWLVASFTGAVGAFFYANVPSLQIENWRGALAWATFLVLWISYFLSIFSAIVVGVSLIFKRRSTISKLNK